MNATALWVILGTLLLVSEMVTGTFVLIFFALGSFCASLVSLFYPQNSSVQFVTCAAVSALGFWLLRQPMKRRLFKANSVHVDIGKELVVDQSMAVSQQGRVNYQGTTWQASNLGSDDIASGDRATIIGIDGNTLLIRKIK